jgi:hypothetical protein
LAFVDCCAQADIAQRHHLPIWAQAVVAEQAAGSRRADGDNSRLAALRRADTRAKVHLDAELMSAIGQPLDQPGPPTDDVLHYTGRSVRASAACTDWAEWRPGSPSYNVRVNEPSTSRAERAGTATVPTP